MGITLICTLRLFFMKSFGNYRKITKTGGNYKKAVNFCLINPWIQDDIPIVIENGGESKF